MQYRGKVYSCHISPIVLRNNLCLCVYSGSSSSLFSEKGFHHHYIQIHSLRISIFWERNPITCNNYATLHCTYSITLKFLDTTYTHVFDKRISTCQNSLLSYSQIYSMFYLTNTLRLLSGTPNLIFLKLNSWTSFPTLSLFWWFLSHLRAIPIIRFYKPEY